MPDTGVSDRENVLFGSFRNGVGILRVCITSKTCLECWGVVWNAGHWHDKYGPNNKHTPWWLHQPVSNRQCNRLHKYTKNEACPVLRTPQDITSLLASSRVSWTDTSVGTCKMLLCVRRLTSLLYRSFWCEEVHINTLHFVCSVFWFLDVPSIHNVLYKPIFSFNRTVNVGFRFFGIFFHHWECHPTYVKVGKHSRGFRLR